MKEVLMHTVMHTGGTFCKLLLLATYKASNAKVRTVIKNYQGSLCSSNNVNDALKGLTVIDNLTKNIRIFSSHHVVPSQPIYNMIVLNKCPIPIVGTIRDPLLVCNTLLWRYISEKTFPIEIEKWRRQKEIERQVEVINESLYLRETNKMFLLPVDLKQIDVACDMFKYCNLRLTKNVCESIAFWKPKNITQKVIKQKTIRQIKHLKVKQAITDRDIDTVKSLLGIEFEYLRKQDTLKKRLENLGYKDLLWF